MDTIKEQHKIARILLVEDNRGDVILTRRALKESKIINHLVVANNGEQALAMLLQEGEYINTELPDLILLDLNLPKMKGHELLKIIKNTPELKRIPVLILSSSKAEQDVIKSYELHGNAYIPKPINLENFIIAMQKIEQFWFSLVLSPESNEKQS